MVFIEQLNRLLFPCVQQANRPQTNSTYSSNLVRSNSKTPSFNNGYVKRNGVGVHCFQKTEQLGYANANGGSQQPAGAGRVRRPITDAERHQLLLTSSVNGSSAAAGSNGAGVGAVFSGSSSSETCLNTLSVSMLSASASAVSLGVGEQQHPLKLSFPLSPSSKE